MSRLVDPETASETRPFARYAEEAESGRRPRLPVRHRVGHRRVAAGAPETLVVNYHNVTPPDLYAAWDNAWRAISCAPSGTARAGAPSGPRARGLVVQRGRAARGRLRPHRRCPTRRHVPTRLRRGDRQSTALGRGAAGSAWAASPQQGHRVRRDGAPRPRAHHDPAATLRSSAGRWCRRTRRPSVASSTSSASTTPSPSAAAERRRARRRHGRRRRAGHDLAARRLRGARARGHDGRVAGGGQPDRARSRRWSTTAACSSTPQTRPPWPAPWRACWTSRGSESALAEAARRRVAELDLPSAGDRAVDLVGRAARLSRTPLAGCTRARAQEAPTASCTSVTKRRVDAARSNPAARSVPAATRTLRSAVVLEHPAHGHGERQRRFVRKHEPRRRRRSRGPR